MGRSVRVLARLAAGALTALVCAVVAGAVLVPRVGGALPYTVLTGSMSPAYPPGTLVVVRGGDDVRVGDVITYQLRSGEPQVVTHRVVGLAYDGEGQLRYRTQGDANQAPDAALVRPEQVRGELWYSLPWVGRLGVLLDPDQHRLLVRLTAGALLAYAAVLLWRARRDRQDRRDRRSAQDGVPQPARHARREAAGV